MLDYSGLNLKISGQPRQFFGHLALCAFLLAFVVILLGAYTRLTNAGLSCPDWPRCYGYLTPPLSSEEVSHAAQAFPQAPLDKTRAWTEMRHRYLAGLEGILILALITLSWCFRRKLSLLAFQLSLGLIVIMLGQILLGRLTVTALLKPVVVLGHLLCGFSVMSICWLLWLLSKKTVVAPLHQHYKPWVGLGLLVLLAQITLGGWVSTHSAGLACIDFPYCNGELLPSLQWKALHTHLVTMHMLHRLGAFITFIYLGLLSLFLSFHTEGRRFGLLLLSFLCLQILLGVLNIIWLRPIPIALAHHAVAALLLLTLLTAWLNAHCQERIYE